MVTSSGKGGLVRTSRTPPFYVVARASVAVGTADLLFSGRSRGGRLFGVGSVMNAPWLRFVVASALAAGIAAGVQPLIESGEPSGPPPPAPESDAFGDASGSPGSEGARSVGPDPAAPPDPFAPPLLAAPAALARSSPLAAHPTSRPPLRVFPPRTLADLARCRGWTTFLRTWRGLPGVATAAGRAEQWTAALAAAGDPVVRQNVIFGAALSGPLRDALPWLSGLVQGAGDAADAEDALCAAAFSGDPQARAGFLALARAPSPARVHRLVDGWADLDAIAAAGTSEAREVLRAWRAIEALDREPYFKRVPFEVTHDWTREGAAALLDFAPGLAMERPDRQALLEGWLTRWPGHPGGDGISLRVGELRMEAGDLEGAARWFAKALTGSDQDRAWHAESPLVSLAESVLPIATVEKLASAGGARAPAHTLFQYAYVRRLASEVSLNAACTAVARIAGEEPGGDLGRAWTGRRCAAPPRGVFSGMLALAEGDPLLSTTSGGPSPTIDAGLRDAWRSGQGCVRRPPSTGDERLAPDAEPTVFGAGRLESQLRAWETLAELEHREARAGGLVHADLLYKQAAIFYHERDVLFPAYGSHTMDFAGRVASRAGDDDSAGRRFASASFAWLRAIALFERIEREHPDYPEMDKVLFSEAMCWKRLVDYRPAFGTRDGSEQRCVALFDRVVSEHPRSSLADDAARAAAWWRRRR